MAIKTASVPEKEDIEIIRNFLPTVIPG
jgi:hypothetical protein